MILTLTLLLAQALQDNPAAEAARALGTRGFAEGADTGTTRFKSDGTRRVVAAFAKKVGDDDAQRKALEEISLKLIEGYEKTAKDIGAESDVAGALAFSVAVLYAGAKEVDLDDQSFLALIGRLRASLDLRGASDVQKQEFYEWSLCSAGLVLSVAQLAESAEAKAGLRRLASAQLGNLIGADVDRLSLKGKEVTLKPAEAAFTFTVPAGWVVEGAWHVCRKGDPQGNDRTTRTAFVRFPPAIDAAGDMGTKLGELWKTSVPEELAGRHSSMVYRRYVGDGLPAQFIFGAGREKGRVSDSLFSLYLIDLGSKWQPMLIAQTYDDPDTNVQAIVGMSARFSYAETAATAEAFLATLRGPKGRALVSKEALVGDYSFGNASQLQWENIYTGATSMTVVSYGGTLNLKADGSYDSTFQSASGQVGALKFASEKEQGTWDVKGDLLTLSAKGKSSSYRVAGLTRFQDGVKVAVLLRPSVVPNAADAGDRGDWYSTKKP